MIVVDIETSGINFANSGIWQIGAIDSDAPDNFFIGECRIEENDIVMEESLRVNNITEESLRDSTKISQKELLQKFFEWCRGVKIKNFVCQNPQFDYAFIRLKAEKYGLDIPVHFRCFDLHSIAGMKYLELNKRLLLRNDYSDMGLPNILNFCGMQDNRKEHNALEDARLTAECFNRIMFGKKLLKEYDDYVLPSYLRRD